MNLRISSPCPESWSAMVGNDRVRFCGRCKLNVYNLAVMKPEEIEALVRGTNGRLCGQLYMRGNRMATLRDCGVGSRRKWIRRGAAVAGILALAAFAWLLRGIDEPNRSVHPSWIRAVLNWIEPERRPTMVRGDVMVVPRRPAPSGF